jgi:hypothetical protein
MRRINIFLHMELYPFYPKEVSLIINKSIESIMERVVADETY